MVPLLTLGGYLVFRKAGAYTKKATELWREAANELGLVLTGERKFKYPMTSGRIDGVMVSVTAGPSGDPASHSRP